MQLQEQVALVTGGARGLGRAVALALAREGCHVVVGDILSNEASDTAREIESTGVRSLGLPVDVSEESAVAALIDRVVDNFGRLDILVNTVAWIDPPGLILEMPIDVWQKTLTFDLTTHFLCCKQALRVMIPRNYGRIVNTSSAAGQSGYRLRGAYGVAKAGVISLSQTLALETAEYDITVNAICPRAIAGIRLDTIRQQFGAYLEAHGGQSLPASRLPPAMPPEEVATSVVFLVSPAAKHLNGQAIIIG